MLLSPGGSGVGSRLAVKYARGSPFLAVFPFFSSRRLAPIRRICVVGPARAMLVRTRGSLDAMDRRLLLQAGAALALGACTRRSPEGAAPPAGSAWRLASFDRGPGAPEGERAMLLAPWPEAGPAPDPASRPLLVALHGRGEAGRGLDVGAGAWPVEYQLDRLHRRLLAPPLLASDLLDMTNAERLGRLNASLAAAPYRGIAVAGPATPDLPDHSPDGARPYGRFIVEELLPRLRAETGSTADRAAT